MASGAIAPGAAWAAVVTGRDVYLFLAGMMILAEIARAEGLFGWAAARASAAARGSAPRLFAMVFALCTVVTIFLSNDATVVVLTPAVVAIARAARLPPLPYAYACAFVANAGSLALPISNPANLVVYGGRLPPLGPWIAGYGLPTLAALAATYLVLRWYVRRDLAVAPRLADEGRAVPLRRRALVALAAAAAAMVAASSAGWDVGIVTALAGAAALAAVRGTDLRAAGALVARINGTILLVVAGLFVVVGALDANGALREAQGLLTGAAALGAPWRTLAAGFGVGVATDVLNNLPVGLAVRYAAEAAHSTGALVRALLVGVDLGPNLSVTGSLATLLWLTALRREGIVVNGLTFMRAGALLMPAALLVALVALG